VDRPSHHQSPLNRCADPNAEAGGETSPLSARRCVGSIHLCASELTGRFSTVFSLHPHTPRTRCRYLANVELLDRCDSASAGSVLRYLPTTHLSMTDSVTTLIGRAKGAVILAFFGAAWVVAGLLESRRASAAAISVVCLSALLIAGVALAQLRRRPLRSFASPFNLRAYGIINAIQWSLIFATAAVLPAVGYRAWVAPVSIMIVGLHFLPLARMFDTLYYATGLSMMVLAAVYPFVSGSGPKSPDGLLGAGLILWATAAVALAANSAHKPEPLRPSA
jgi:hypothetical protein